MGNVKCGGMRFGSGCGLAIDEERTMVCVGGSGMKLRYQDW